MTLPLHAQQTTAADAATTAAVSPASDSLVFDGGVQNDNAHVSGNAHHYEQYVSPAQGLSLTPLELRFYLPDSRLQGDLQLRNLGNSSQGGNLWASLDSGALYLRAQLRRSEFYRDWSSSGQALARNDGAYNLLMPIGKTEWQLGYTNTNLMGNGAATPEAWTLESFGLSGARSVQGWPIRVGFTEEAFTFDQGDRYTGNTHAVNIRFNTPLAGRSQFGGSAVLAQTFLNGSSTSPWNYRLALDGSHELTKDLTLTADAMHLATMDAIAQNFYASSDSSADLRADYQGIAHTQLTVGGMMRAVDVVNVDEKTTTPVTQNSAFGEVRVHLYKSLKVKARLDHQWTGNRPASFDATDFPEKSLFWSAKDDQQLEVSYAPNWRAGVTARWRQLSWQNKDFATDNALLERNLTGWYLLNDRVTVYATYLVQNFDLTGTDPTVPAASDGFTLSSGASWQVLPLLNVDIAYSNTDSRGALNLNQRTLSLGTEYQWKFGGRLSAHVALDDFNAEAGSTVPGYRAVLFNVQFTEAF